MGGVRHKLALLPPGLLHRPYGPAGKPDAHGQKDRKADRRNQGAVSHQPS